MIKYILFMTILMPLTTILILRLILMPFDTELEMKFILIWTNPNRTPISRMGSGQNAFQKRNCPVSNCYVTHIKSVVRRITDFDAILFHGPELGHSHFHLPKIRSNQQKYIYLSMESPVRFTFKFHKFSGIFNWTMTYKFNSDLYLGYIIIRNMMGQIIGPKAIIHWLNLKDMKPIDSAFKKKLMTKKYAAAWFVSNNNNTRNLRREIALEIQKELASYNMKLDIYGTHEKIKCPRKWKSQCLSILERDYYFYLSFENSLSDDYVTEKILTALQHHTVPIVYGGANYTRFMPDGSYLDVRTLGIKMLVKKMVDSIRNKEIYYDFFRWTNHYSYHYIFEDAPDADPFCELCNRLNEANLMKETSIYKYFSVWWQSKTCSDIHNIKKLPNGSIEPLNLIKVTCSP